MKQHIHSRRSEWSWQVVGALSLAVLAAVSVPPAGAISTRTLIAPVGEAPGDLFGNTICPAGDVNGDGFADVLVAAALNDAGGNDTGRIYLYHGGPGADAIADLVFTGEAAGDQFGVFAFTAGDVNGDGYDDIVIGAWLNDAAGINAGRAYLYYGGPFANPVPDLVLSGTIAEDNFGYTSTTVGDVNHDGHADLLITAPQFGGAGGNGRAFIFFGGPAIDSVPDLTINGAGGEALGSWADAAGDVNGDGEDDFLIGATSNDVPAVDAGRAYLFHGGPAVLNAIPDLILSGEAAGDLFGTVARTGDVNGDGYDDMLVGAARNDAGGADAGRAYVFFGGPFADPVADVVLTGAAAGDRFGRGNGPAGDVNGDGYADILVCAHLNDAGGANAGRIYLYLGGPSADFPAQARQVVGEKEERAVIGGFGHEPADCREGAARRGRFRPHGPHHRGELRQGRIPYRGTWETWER